MTGAVTRQHSSVKRFRELARTPAGNSLDRELLLDGLHLLSEAFASGITVETAAFERTALDHADACTLAEQLAASGAEVLIVSRNVLEAMSPVKTPSGAIGIARRSLASLPAVLKTSAPLVLLAHDVQDPGNVGALIRAAEAAGATAFVVCGSTADAFGWKALRGSMGSALRLPVAKAATEEALRACAKAGIVTAALSPRGGEPFYRADFRQPAAILVGSEGAGVPPQIGRLAERQLSIPMHGPVESLNVAVAAGLVLYEAFRQRMNM